MGGRGETCRQFRRGPQPTSRGDCRSLSHPRRGGATNPEKRSGSVLPVLHRGSEAAAKGRILEIVPYKAPAGKVKLHYSVGLLQQVHLRSNCTSGTSSLLTLSSAKDSLTLGEI